MVLDEFLVKLGLQDDLSTKLEGVGRVLKGVGAAMGAFAVAAGAAAIKIGTEVVAGFGELEQSLGGSVAVFGEYAEETQKIGEDAYKNLGVSQSEYLATANKMGALFQGSGVEQQKSLDLTTQAMQRAADMASVMGIDMQVALDSVAGAAKGNFTMMDNLGVAMNATNIEAYALAKGLEFTWNTATDAQKAEVAMQMFFENTAQYAGNFARESTQTISGSLGLLRAALGSFTAGLGNADADMQNHTENLVDAFEAVVSNIIPILENIVRTIPQAASAILEAIGSLLPSLLATATGLFSSVLQTILSLLPQLIPVAVEAIITITTALTDNVPLLIDAAIQLIIALIEGLGQALPKLVPAAVNAVQTIAKTIVDRLPELVDAGMQMMGGLIEGLLNTSPLIRTLAGILGAVIAAMSAYKAVVAATAVVQGVQTAATTALTAAVLGEATAEAVKTAAKSVGMTVDKAGHLVTAAGAAATTAETIAVLASAGALTGKTVIVGLLTGTISLATAAQWLWNAAMTANPIGLIIAGVAALTVGIIALVGWFNHQTEEEKRLQEQTKALTEENAKLNESIGETSAAYGERTASIERDGRAAESLADKIDALSTIENKSAEQKAQLTAYVDMLNEAMGESIVNYDAETDSMSRNIDEIYALVEAHKEEAKGQAARERAVEIAKEQMEVEEQLGKITRQRMELDQALAAGTVKKSHYRKEVEKLNESEAELAIRQSDLIISFDDTTEAMVQAAAATEAANAAIATGTEEVADAMAEANAKQEQLANDRIASEQAVTDAMIRAANEQGLTLDEYQDKLKETQEALAGYTEAATDMFSRLSEESKLSINDMTANMEHNQQVVENWSNNISDLAARGIDEGLLERLRSAGPESAGTVAALVNGSEEELARLNDVFQNGSEVATDALMKQLGLAAVTSSGSHMVDDIAAGVDDNTSLAVSTVNLIQDAKAAAKEAVDNSGFDTVGKAIIDGVHTGFLSRKEWFREQIHKLFSGIITDVKELLGIQSPSKVFADIGEHMAEGVGVGFEDEMPDAGHRIKLSMDNTVAEAAPAGEPGTAMDYMVKMAEIIAEKLCGVTEKLSPVIQTIAPALQTQFDDKLQGDIQPKESLPKSEPANEKPRNNEPKSTEKHDPISGILSTIGNGIAKLLTMENGAGEPHSTEDMRINHLMTIGTNMSQFLDNANRIAAQMGASSVASYATSTNNSISYDNRTFDMKSSFNINDSSGQPVTTAQMVDKNQSLRIRNLRGVFS